MLSLLAMVLALGPENVFGVGFVVVIVLALSVGGGGGGGGGGGAGESPVAHFSFPAEFHLVKEEEGGPGCLGERPQVRLHIAP